MTFFGGVAGLGKAIGVAVLAGRDNSRTSSGRTTVAVRFARALGDERSAEPMNVACGLSAM